MNMILAFEWPPLRTEIDHLFEYDESLPQYSSEELKHLREFFIRHKDCETRREFGRKSYPCTNCSGSGRVCIPDGKVPYVDYNVDRTIWPIGVWRFTTAYKKVVCVQCGGRGYDREKMRESKYNPNGNIYRINELYRLKAQKNK